MKDDLRHVEPLSIIREWFYRYVRTDNWIDGTPQKKNLGQVVCLESYDGRLENRDSNWVTGTYRGGNDKYMVIDNVPFCRAGFKRFRVVNKQSMQDVTRRQLEIFVAEIRPEFSDVQKELAVDCMIAAGIGREQEQGGTVFGHYTYPKG